jgi:hypothetical protein
MNLFREVAADRWERDGRRWFLTKLISADHPQGPMLRRYMIFQGARFGVYVHQFFRPDADRDVHDHPWWFATLVLRGGYLEQVADNPDGLESADRSRWSLRGRAHVMPRTAAHRIKALLPNTWTLLLVGPKMQEWGFYVERESELDAPRWVWWRDYGAVTADPMDS